MDTDQKTSVPETKINGRNCRSNTFLQESLKISFYKADLPQRASHGNIQIKSTPLIWSNYQVPAKAFNTFLSMPLLNATCGVSVSDIKKGEMTLTL